jgi:hypothetical protein
MWARWLPSGQVPSPGISSRSVTERRQSGVDVVQGGSLVLTDTDKASNKGIWAAHAPEFAEGKVTVTRRVLGRRDHRTICKSNSLVLD